MDEREKNGNVRNDLIDTLVCLRNEDKHKNAGTADFGKFKKDCCLVQYYMLFLFSNC